MNLNSNLDSADWIAGTSTEHSVLSPSKLASAAQIAGFRHIETIEPTSDVASVTFDTTDFSAYRYLLFTFIGTSTSGGSAALEGNFGGTWRTIAESNSFTSGNLIMTYAQIFNPGNQDGTGVVFARQTHMNEGFTFDRSDNGDYGDIDEEEQSYQARGVAITGLRYVGSGLNFEGSNANARSIFTLFGGVS